MKWEGKFREETGNCPNDKTGCKASFSRYDPRGGAYDALASYPKTCVRVCVCTFVFGWPREN